MIIYISGPITGTTDFPERFEIAEQIVRAVHPEAKILNPVVFCAGIPNGSAHAVYMDKCLEELDKASHIVLMDGWYLSKGCIEEVDRAQELQLKFLFRIEL